MIVSYAELRVNIYLNLQRPFKPTALVTWHRVEAGSRTAQSCVAVHCLGIVSAHSLQ